MHIAFVHTPMSAYSVPEREQFWRHFDMQYHAAHPGLRHMRKVMWELPHWMHWLAGVLVHHGHTAIQAIAFYDAVSVQNGIDRSAIIDSIKRNPADCYLFSPMTPNLAFAYQIADVIKEQWPNSAVVFGGVVATPLCREVASHPSVDYVVRDRGEYALPALLDALSGKMTLQDVGNLSYKTTDGTVVTNERTYPHMPARELPFPKVDLFPRSAGSDIRYLRQVHALGCPYKCSFCTIQTIGRKPDYFPLDRITREIRAYRAHYGEHHNIYWGDETFTVHHDHTLALCDAIEELNLVYDCQTRLNCLSSPKLLETLYRSGCRWIEVGIETGNQESQNLFKQNQRVDEIEDVLRTLRDTGIAACSFVVNGFPNQTPDDMRRSIDWICSLLAKDLLQASYLFGLVPYPGSDMYDNPERSGMRIRHRDYRYYHEDMLPVFDTAYATAEQTYTVFLDGVRSFGQAMAKRPYLGPAPPPERLHEYGTFWTGSHI